MRNAKAIKKNKNKINWVMKPTSKEMKDMIVERMITADRAYSNLEKLINYAKKSVNISVEFENHCYEWLYDCLHNTGNCKASLPLIIFNESYVLFKKRGNN